MPLHQIIRNLSTSVTDDIKKILQNFVSDSDNRVLVKYTQNAVLDSRFSKLKSVQNQELVSFLAASFDCGNGMRAGIYLDFGKQTNMFSDQLVNLIQSYVKVVGYFIHEARKIQELSESRKDLIRELTKKYRFGTVLGKSDYMLGIFQKMESVMYTNYPVLITGEPGTGKKLVAHVIHYNSHRKNGKLIVINCSTLPEQLTGAEFFMTSSSVVRGSQTKLSRIELANGGTLVLDEVSALPLRAQKSLVDLIQSKRSGPAEKSPTSEIDIRIIATTSMDIRSLVQLGDFSEELYTLLKGSIIDLPSLMDRSEDIPMLVDYFLNAASRRSGLLFSSVGTNAIKALLQFQWPGNVRQLERTIDTAVMCGTPPVIQLSDLPREIRVPFAKAGGKYEPELQSMEEVEEAHIRYILSVTGGNKLRACQLLKISRPTLDRKLEKYNIQVKRSKR